MANHRELLIQAARVNRERAEECLDAFLQKKPLLFEATAGIIALLAEIGSTHKELQLRIAKIVDLLFANLYQSENSSQSIVLTRSEVKVIRNYHLPELWQVIAHASKDLRISALSAAILLLKLDKPSRKKIPSAACTLRPGMEQWEVRLTLQLDLLAASSAWFPDLQQLERVFNTLDEHKQMIIADLCVDLPHIPRRLIHLLLEASRSDNPQLNAAAIEAAANNKWFTWQVVCRAVDMLKEEDHISQQGALKALGRLGPYAVRAISNVEAMRNLHPQLVDEVLAKIGPGPRELRDSCAL